MQYPRVTRWYRCPSKVVHSRGTAQYERLMYLHKKKEVLENQTGIRHVIEKNAKGLIAIFICQYDLFDNQLKGA